MIHLSPPHIVHNYEALHAPLEALPPHYFAWLDWYWQGIQQGQDLVNKKSRGQPPDADLIAEFTEYRDALRLEIPLYIRDTLLGHMALKENEAYIIDSLRTNN